MRSMPPRAAIPSEIKVVVILAVGAQTVLHPFTEGGHLTAPIWRWKWDDLSGTNGSLPEDGWIAALMICARDMGSDRRFADLPQARRIAGKAPGPRACAGLSD